MSAHVSGLTPKYGKLSTSASEQLQLTIAGPIAAAIGNLFLQSIEFNITENITVPWVEFTSAAQAFPGTRMRRKFRAPVPGRPKERTVSKRERGVIYFSDGAIIKIADAKYGYEIYEAE